MQNQNQAQGGPMMPGSIQAIPPDRSKVGCRRTCAPVLILGSCLLGLATFVCLVMVFLGVAIWNDWHASPRIVSGIVPGRSVEQPYQLSPEQQELVDAWGYPESFSILFYEETLEDGTIGDVRYEVWSFYTRQKMIIFINGERVSEEGLEGDLGQSIPTSYQPGQFGRYMSRDELIASAGLEGYMVLPLEEALVSGGEVYYASGITFGMKDGELLFVETLILTEGG